MCKFLNREDAKARQEERAGITGAYKDGFITLYAAFFLYFFVAI